MKSFKFIVLLFGIGCSDLNHSNSLTSNSVTSNCDLNGIYYYENNYSIIDYKHKEQKKY